MRVSGWIRVLTRFASGWLVWATPATASATAGAVELVFFRRVLDGTRPGGSWRGATAGGRQSWSGRRSFPASGGVDVEEGGADEHHGVKTDTPVGRGSSGGAWSGRSTNSSWSVWSAALIPATAVEAEGWVEFLAAQGWCRSFDIEELGQFGEIAINGYLELEGGVENEEEDEGWALSCTCEGYRDILVEIDEERERV